VITRLRGTKELLDDIEVTFHSFIEFSSCPEVALDIFLGATVTCLLARVGRNITGNDKDKLAGALVWGEGEYLLDLGKSVFGTKALNTFALERP
jgi:hypothetical protein